MEQNGSHKLLISSQISGLKKQKLVVESENISNNSNLNDVGFLEEMIYNHEMIYMFTEMIYTMQNPQKLESVMFTIDNHLDSLNDYLNNELSLDENTLSNVKKNISQWEDIKEKIQEFWDKNQ